jgi:hypothetical protein
VQPGESSCQVKLDSNADATLSGSTQTALVLAELAAEHSDKTFCADETLTQLLTGPRDCTPANAAHAAPSFKCAANNEILSSDGFCLQSTEDEVIYVMLHITVTVQ